MLENCFRFAPRDSIPGLITKICRYLKDHPGWSEEELEDQIKKFVSATGVESFNGRTGSVTLDENDVNNLKIAGAYFAGNDETINSLNLLSLYNEGVRFVFTDFNNVTSGYNLAFVLEYSEATNEVRYYPMATGSGGGGNIVSVNGKTGVVELTLSDVIGDSSAQVKLCTAEEFASTATEMWNAYYNEGYRIVGVANSTANAIDSIYILKQNENDHTPIGLSAGASNAYTPDNPPPYPVDSVNDKTGEVELKVVDVSNGNSSDKNAYLFVDELEDYPDVAASDSNKLGGKVPSYYATAEEVGQLSDNKANKTIISDAWQTGKTYNAGAYCIYNNALYKATVQTNANPTNGSDWQKCTITEEIPPENKLVVHNQTNSTKETLISLIVNAIGDKKGLFSIVGSWTQHPNGYAAVVNSGSYDNDSSRYSGTIYAFDGAGYSFIASRAGEQITMKIYTFTMN